MEEQQGTLMEWGMRVLATPDPDRKVEYTLQAIKLWHDVRAIPAHLTNSFPPADCVSGVSLLCWR